MKRLFFALALTPCFTCFGQTILTLDSAIASALRSHPLVQLAQQEILQQQAVRKGSFSLPAPELTAEAPYGKKFELGVQQNIDDPIVYIQQAKLGKQNVVLAESGLEVNKASLIFDVKTAYINLQYAEIRVSQLSYQDSLFRNLADAAEKRFNAGDAGVLEKISAEAQSKEMENKLAQAKTDLLNAQQQLLLLTGGKDPNIKTNAELNKIVNIPLMMLNIDTTAIMLNPVMKYYSQNILVNRQNLRLQQWRIAPGFMIGYLNQVGPMQPFNYRMRYGITIPIWFWTYSSQIKVAKYQYQMSQTQYSIAQKNYGSKYLQAVADQKKYYESLNYYESTGLKQADAIINAAIRSYNSGEINYIVYMQSLNQAFEIKSGYYETLKNYNQSVILVNYITGK